MFELPTPLPTQDCWSWCVGQREPNLPLPELLPTKVQTWPLITLEQTHGHQIAVVSQPHSAHLMGVDAALTRLPQVILTIRTADCLPILLSHPGGWVGAIHAGRRGTEQEILKHTLEKALQLGASNYGWQIWFGPAICESCYEIDRQSHAHFDLLSENEAQLRSVLPATGYQLIIAHHCTLEENHHWYSYRGHGPGSPMNYSGIAAWQASMNASKS